MSSTGPAALPFDLEVNQQVKMKTVVVEKLKLQEKASNRRYHGKENSLLGQQTKFMLTQPKELTI